MKRVISVVLAMALLLSLTGTALAADSAKATTLRLSTTEGTVTLRNENGRALTVREDRKLYSGYTVETAASSYAYISLDESKAVKLDASTTVEIRKSGKKLEVLVTAGKLFFNVTAPLEDDESLEIRTSTIVTGIRGTAGVIDCITAQKSALYLLDGSVTMQAMDPTTGKTVAVPVQAGQSAVVDQQAPAGATGTAAPVVEVKTLEAKEVPGFAATEIAKDTVLQEKIAQQSKLDVKQVVEKAAETLVQEQKKAEEAHKQVEQAVAREENTQTVVPTTPAPAPNPPQDGGGSDSGTPPVTPDPPTPPVTPPSTLTGTVTADQITAALASYGTVTLSPDSTVHIPSGTTLTVPTGKELRLTAGAAATALAVDAGAKLEVSGLLRLSATSGFTNSGSLVLKTGKIAAGTDADLGTVLGAGDAAYTPWCMAVAANGTSETYWVPNFSVLLGSLSRNTAVAVTVQTSGTSFLGYQAGSTTAGASATFPVGLMLTLDYNGQTLETKGGGITNQGTLTLTDSSAAQTGKLDLGTGQLNNTGALTVTGGTVTGGNTTVMLLNAANRTTQISGGKLENSGIGAVIQNNGTLQLSGTATVTGNSATAAVVNGATAITTSEVAISGSAAVTSTGGSGVAVQNFGIVNVSGGTVSGTNTALAQSNAAAQLHVSGGTLEGVAFGILAETSGLVELSGGTVQATAENGLAVKGSFSMVAPGALVQVKKTSATPSAVCDVLPAGYTVAADGTDWWKLVSTGG